MKKFYLFCEAGMSTSMLAQKMQETATKHNLPIEIKAFNILKLDELTKNEQVDLILLGPQIRHMYDDVVNRYKDSGIPVMLIDSADYGMMAGDKILRTAIDVLKKEKL